MLTTRVVPKQRSEHKMLFPHPVNSESPAGIAAEASWISPILKDRSAQANSEFFLALVLGDDFREQ